MNINLISKIFEKLSHAHGYQFTSTYGESAFVESTFSDKPTLTGPAKTWYKALERFSDEQIAYGLRQSMELTEKWLTLAVFVSLCKTKPPPKMFKAALESDELIANRKSQYKKGLAELRDILKK